MNTVYRSPKLKLDKSSFSRCIGWWNWRPANPDSTTGNCAWLCHAGIQKLLDVDEDAIYQICASEKPPRHQQYFQYKMGHSPSIITFVDDYIVLREIMGELGYWLKANCEQGYIWLEEV